MQGATSAQDTAAGVQSRVREGSGLCWPAKQRRGPGCGPVYRSLGMPDRGSPLVPTVLGLLRPWTP